MLTLFTSRVTARFSRAPGWGYSAIELPRTFFFVSDEFTKMKEEIPGAVLQSHVKSALNEIEKSKEKKEEKEETKQATGALC